MASEKALCKDQVDLLEPRRKAVRLEEGVGESVKGIRGLHVELGSHRFLCAGEWKPLEGFEPKE